MNTIIELSWIQLIFAFAYVIVSTFIVMKLKLSQSMNIIIASVRMSAQLVITGFVLIYLFDHPSWITSLSILLLMEWFAVYTILKRSKYKVSTPLKRIVTGSMMFATTISLLYFLIVVVNIIPWYQPQYFITIAGMLIGNSMTGISLGLYTLLHGFKQDKAKIEGLLMLGANQRQAMHHLISQSFEAAIIPTINSMLGMGIIFLPGMMTGQILSGTSPLIAISYQIAIMFGILGSVSLSVYLFLRFGSQTFFNADTQIIEE
jgi:putative ABC transport system permease protein